MMKKTLYFVSIFLVKNTIYATSQSWQDYNNSLYSGFAVINNNLSVNNLGNSSSTASMVNLGLNTLLNNQLYFQIEASYYSNTNIDFNHNWYLMNTKTGYSYQFDKLNLIPYVDLGFGSNGTYFSSATNLNYGLGIIGQIILNQGFLAYVDFNYQQQFFDNQINTDLNNEVNIASNYKINSNQNYNVNLGVKYVTENGFYFNPFINYQYYEQNFNGNNSFGYEQINPSISQTLFGINFGIVL